MFDFNNSKYFIMGILNITHDSFYDGGRYTTIDKALDHCREMIDEGVDIIDVGAISTKPGFDINNIIPIEKEKERIMPIVWAIKGNFDVSVSVDTFRAEVADEALRLGVDIINDQYGLNYDESMAEVIKKYNCTCVLMHNKDCSGYDDFITYVKEDLKSMVRKALNTGIKPEKIILDPGIGFGKTPQQNMQVLKHLKEIGELGYPLLLGCSRKSFIGTVLNNDVDERLYGTLATTAYGYINGVSIFRVHDVKSNVEVLKMLKAIDNSDKTNLQAQALK